MDLWTPGTIAYTKHFGIKLCIMHKQLCKLWKNLWYNKCFVRSEGRLKQLNPWFILIALSQWNSDLWPLAHMWCQIDCT